MSSYFDKFMVFLATGFWVGYSKKAPGTLGSVVGLPFGYLLASASLSLQEIIIAWVVCCGLGFLITYRAEKIFGIHDDQRIVVDEVVGQIIAISLFPATLLYAVCGFLLFRLFDIWKPGPIGYIDEHLPGAWGTFFDDVLAGLVSAGVLFLLHNYVFSL